MRDQQEREGTGFVPIVIPEGEAEERQLQEMIQAYIEANNPSELYDPQYHWRMAVGAADVLSRPACLPHDVRLSSLDFLQSFLRFEHFDLVPVCSRFAADRKQAVPDSRFRCRSVAGQSVNR